MEEEAKHYLHNFGQDRLVKVIFQCWFGNVSLEHVCIFILNQRKNYWR